MKKIIDVIIGTVLSFSLITFTYPHNVFVENWYCFIGTAFGLGLAYSVNIWTKDRLEERINDLEDEINELKKK